MVNEAIDGHHNSWTIAPGMSTSVTRRLEPLSQKLFHHCDPNKNGIRIDVRRDVPVIRNAIWDFEQVFNVAPIPGERSLP